VNWISKQSAIMLAFSDGRNLMPEAPWITVGALGPSLVRRNFAMGHIAWVWLQHYLFFLPPFKCLFTGHLPDSFRDPVDCRFTYWIPGFLPQIFVASASVLTTDPNQGNRCWGLEV
jgi:hypothetical protein